MEKIVLFYKGKNYIPQDSAKISLNPSMIMRQLDILENWKLLMPYDNITGGLAYEHMLKTMLKTVASVNSSRSIDGHQNHHSCLLKVLNQPDLLPTVPWT